MSHERTVILRGPFDDEDLRGFAQALRHAERKAPDQNYLLLVDDKGNPAASEHEMLRKMTEMFPTLPGGTSNVCWMPTGGQGDGEYGLQMVLRGKGILLGATTTIGEVTAHLGEPDYVSDPKVIKHGTILKYGDTELSFLKDGRLHFVHREDPGSGAIALAVRFRGGE